MLIDGNTGLHLHRAESASSQSAGRLHEVLA